MRKNNPQRLCLNDEKTLNMHLERLRPAPLVNNHPVRVRESTSGSLPEEVWFAPRDAPRTVAAPCPILYDCAHGIQPGHKHHPPTTAFPAEKIRGLSGALAIVSPTGPPVDYRIWASRNPLLRIYCPPSPPSESFDGIYCLLRDNARRIKSIWWQYPSFRRSAESMYAGRMEVMKAVSDKSVFAALMGFNLVTWGADSVVLASTLNLAPFAVSPDRYDGWEYYRLVTGIVEPHRWIYEDLMRLVRME